jgi:regulatory factor X
MASTGSRKRPRSRASTASIHSVTTQPNLDQGFAVDGADEYAAGHWIPVDQASPKDHTAAPSQMSPEELILQAASQLQSGRDISLDAHHPDGISFTHRNSMDSQAAAADSFVGNASYLDPDSQMQDVLDDGDSMTGVSGQQKMIAKSSANNEKEMLQLFTLNKHRSLQDVAEELHGNERGPNSERTRQVFAMLWCARPLPFVTEKSAA